MLSACQHVSEGSAKKCLMFSAVHFGIALKNKIRVRQLTQINSNRSHSINTGIISKCIHHSSSACLLFEKFKVKKTTVNTCLNDR